MFNSLSPHEQTLCWFCFISAGKKFGLARAQLYSFASF